MCSFLLLNKNQKPRSSGCGKQCDQIGRFLTVLAHKFSIKSCPNSSRLFGPVWKIIVKETKKLWTLLGKFRKIWATLISKYGHTELARDSKSRGHELKSCKRWTVVVLNWSVWSPSAPTIRVWIPLKSTVAFFQMFFKWVNPGLFFVYFQSFHSNITIFTTNQCEKCPSSIRHWALNSQPSDYQSPPLATRPELPPYSLKCLKWTKSKEILIILQKSFEKIKNGLKVANLIRVLRIITYNSRVVLTRNLP